jgi:tetratricopeptide (TPR) repeat protein
VADRLLVDLDASGLVIIATWPDGGLPEAVSQARLVWPLDGEALEDLRWYLEDYLRAPFGVWEDRGPRIEAQLAGWGEAVFSAVFASGPARDAYQRARERGLELVIRSASPTLLGLPWELMRDSTGPAALGLAGVSRALPTAELAQTAIVPGERLRVLMVISRPAGTRDIGYQMIARPLLERLDAVRGQVDLVVLRPPTLDALRDALAEAVAAGQPFHLVHFDGHGALPVRQVGAAAGGRRGTTDSMSEEGVLAFERPGGGSDAVAVSKVAAVLRDGRVPVVVLNACQSGAVGKDVEAAIATRLMRQGCEAVVAMAYSVYAVAAAEFMAVFYERLFAGDTIAAAVTAGRRRLFETDRRPSPKGDLPLADWLVPVHYLGHEVRFPQVQTRRSKGERSLEVVLDDLRAPGVRRRNEAGSLDPSGVFVGRDDLLLELDATVRLQKVVVLHGLGGIGKTELAKAFGRWWRDTGGVDQPEWVLWHSFEPGVASFGLDGVIAETGMRVFGPEFARLDDEDRSWALARLLGQRRRLLIWDNFETVRSMPDPTGATAPLDDSECEKLKRFLDSLAANGNAGVVIVSRTAEDWLGPFHHIEVGGLAPDEAAQHARELLSPYPAAAVQQEQRAFGDLLEWLNGHPMSMQLILPRLNENGPDALLEGLRGTASLPGGDTGGDRNTSMAASITYSLAHVSDQTRRLLPGIGLFHGIANADILSGISQVRGVPGRFAEISREDWAAALDDAARVGLLAKLGSGMYRIHPALPAYLAGQWRTEEPEAYDGARDAATRALVAACAGLSGWLDEQIQSGEAGLVYAAIGLVRRTLEAALGYAVDHQMWAEAQAIVSPLDSYWDARGLDDEADAWTYRVQSATQSTDGSPPRMDTSAGNLWRFVIGAWAGRQQKAMHLDAAERTYRQILKLLQVLPTSEAQRSNISSAFHNLGVVASARGRLEEAEEFYRKSLAIHEDLGDRRGMATSYHQLGSIARDQGRLEEAENWYRKSLDIRKDGGDLPYIAWGYHELGNIAYLRGRLEDAGDWYRKSVAIREQLRDLPAMASSYHQLGVIAQNRGRLEDAEYWHRKSLAITEHLGDRFEVAGSYHQLGIIARERGRLEDAGNWYRKSLAIFESLGDQSHVAFSYHELGNVAKLQGRLDEAEDWHRKSLAIFESLGDRLHAASNYHELGNVAYLRRQLEEAGDWYRESLAIREDLKDRPGMALSYGQLGLLAEQQGQPHQALEWLIRCATMFSEFPHPTTRPAAVHLANLTVKLGIHTLETSWREVTGSPLPEAIRIYISSRRPGTS